MPILNEERHLAESVAAITEQDWDGPLEIILALGPSTDATDDVARRLAASDPRIRLVDNPTGLTPEALNLAIGQAAYDIVARVDGHGLLSPGYLRTAATTLAETGAANVGGIMYAEGTTPFERAVACAMKSRIGVGGARFKLGGQAGEAETVYLGVFDRGWLQRVGGYDTRFRRAQDWEMNWRLRALGGTVWFTPQMRVTYRPRGTFATLASQYFQYGTWRRVVARRHKGSINARYLAPPVAVAAIAVGAVGGLVWRPLWLVPAAYLTAIAAGGWAISQGEPAKVRALVPPVLATMHLAWGAGFLTSRVRLAEDVQDPPSNGPLHLASPGQQQLGPR
ncbi:glycosyltransferase family 2 protein [Calidifontibacter sp. DB0510]|uniref:Glycosyltransferase family 2 protein n=2 Tax=Metallococcus carri TaxID=1656884 RepID=A0A967E8W9_9MICO|nr:glycosyltransferase family 2 protein [Metallococcus carri]NOP36546.1 glycosyltransferase family 2 protein [Calidifontibacter sp. DB2511S]